MTLVTNRCYSAGILLAAAGDKGSRYAYQEAGFMIHFPTYEINGKFNLATLYEQYKAKARLHQRYINMISFFTGITAERLDQEFQRDTYFNAQTAAYLGVIDHVLVSAKQR